VENLPIDAQYPRKPRMEITSQANGEKVEGWEFFFGLYLYAFSNTVTFKTLSFHPV
jgi:hypothetical protein